MMAVLGSCIYNKLSYILYVCTHTYIYVIYIYMRKNSGRLICNDTLETNENQNTVQRPHVKELASDALDPVIINHCGDSEKVEVVKMEWRRRKVHEVKSL